MEIKKRASAGLLLVALAATLFASGMIKRPSTRADHNSATAVHTGLTSAMVKPSAGGDEHACCHAKVAQDPGQPGQEQEGNPGHKRPEQSCSYKPEKKQVGCHCQVDCNPDGTEKEEAHCKSYCYKDMCTCPRRPCAE